MAFAAVPLDTKRDLLQLRIPKLQQGSLLRPFLEPRKSFEKVLIATIGEA